MSGRVAARSTLGWAFGMSVSILFLALWGRAVVIDTDTLAESLSPLAGSSTVVDFVSDWMEDEMVDSGADPELTEPAIDYFFESSTMGETLDQFAEEVVYAAASSDPGGATIDMAELVDPAVPEVTRGLVELGYPVTESGVSEVVQRFDPLVIRQPGSGALVGPASPTAARLGMAALFALVAIIGFGGFYVSLSEDRINAVRSLFTRVAVGGLSFAVFLRAGSWVLDPDGGRAPISETVSSLAASKWLVPLQVAAVAAVVAGAMYVGRKALRRAGVIPSPTGQSTPSPEQRESLSRSR